MSTAPKKAGPQHASTPKAGPSKPHRPETLAKSHEAHSSIRGQTAKQKQKAKEQKKTQLESVEGLGGTENLPTLGVAKGKNRNQEGSKPFVKAVLANPLQPKWPDIPQPHHESILQLLCSALPEIAEYHTSRVRCHKKNQRAFQKTIKPKKASKTKTSGKLKRPLELGSQEVDEGRENKRIKVAHDATSMETLEDGEIPEEEEEEQVEPVELDHRPAGSSTNIPSVPSKPEKPELLQHIVCGINEIYKTMERQTAYLAHEVNEILNYPATRKTQPQGDGVYKLSELMNTDTGDKAANAPTESKKKTLASPPVLPLTRAPLRVIFACKGDINPIDLITPVLAYITSWNALVRQCRSRLQARMREVKKQAEEGEVLEEFWDRAVKALVRTEEVYLVPLERNSEIKLAAAMGLRRVALVGLDTGFPQVKTFVDTLDNLSIRPPLPSFPIQAYDPTIPDSFPVGPVYAATQLKAVHTTALKDPKGRKIQRLEQVKAKRIERKEKNVAARERMKKEGVMICGKLRGGTDAAEKEKKEIKDKATEKNRVRQQKLKQNQSAAGQAQLIPTQPSDVTME